MKTPKSERKSFSIGKNNKSIKKVANAVELKTAKELGGKTTPKSGAHKTFATDIYLGKYAFDIKSTSKKQIIVNEEMLQKLEHDAMNSNKEPVLLLHFPKHVKCDNKKWVLLPLDNFKEIIDA